MRNIIRETVISVLNEEISKRTEDTLGKAISHGADAEQYGSIGKKVINYLRKKGGSKKTVDDVKDQAERVYKLGRETGKLDKGSLGRIKNNIDKCGYDE